MLASFVPGLLYEDGIITSCGRSTVLNYEFLYKQIDIQKICIFLILRDSIQFGMI